MTTQVNTIIAVHGKATELELTALAVVLGLLRRTSRSGRRPPSVACGQFRAAAGATLQAPLHSAVGQPPWSFAQVPDPAPAQQNRVSRSDTHPADKASHLLSYPDVFRRAI